MSTSSGTKGTLGNGLLKTPQVKSVKNLHNFSLYVMKTEIPTAKCCTQTQHVYLTVNLIIGEVCAALITATSFERVVSSVVGPEQTEWRHHTDRKPSLHS